jgi:hypothetical protein
MTETERKEALALVVRIQASLRAADGVEDQVQLVAKTLQAARSENMCDACAGEGQPIPGAPCMCGGTGRMSVAALYLREQLYKTEEKLQQALTASWLDEKAAWSNKTFGTSLEAERILRHIEKELSEIRQNPKDLMEWVDVVLLALDGAQRAGFGSDEILKGLKDKQALNMKREWVLPTSPEEPIEHKRSDEKQRVE